MAVSQYMRPGSLIEAVKGYLTPNVVRSASSLTGESEASTTKALGGVVPTLLGGVTNMASSEKGSSNLMSMIHEGDFAAALDNPSSFFGGNATQKMMGVGTQLTGSMFGNRSGSITDAVARTSGIKSSSANSLMALAAPLVMGVIGKQIVAHGLSASGLSSMLAGQKSEFISAMPPGVSQMIGSGPTAAPRPVSTETYQEETYHKVDRQPRSEAYTGGPLRTEQSSNKWLYWLLPLAILAAAFLLFRGRTANVASDVSGALTNIRLPGGASLSVPQGSINYKLAQFLGDNSAQAPQTFVFDHLNFQSGTTELTSDSVQTVNNLGSVLKAYPNAQVQLSGHTDNTGAADANQALSLSRANTVKDLLVNSGVGSDRISTTGHGQDRPIASNDTEQGKAQNRRIELTVTRK